MIGNKRLVSSQGVLCAALSEMGKVSGGVRRNDVRIEDVTEIIIYDLKDDTYRY